MQPRYTEGLIPHGKTDLWAQFLCVDSLPLASPLPPGFPNQGLGYIRHCHTDRFPIMVVLYFSCNFDVVVRGGKPCLPMPPFWPEEVWLLKNRLTIPSAVKEAWQIELSFFIGWNMKWCSHYGKHYKVQHILTVRPSNSTSGINPSQMKLMFAQNSIYECCISSCIHNHLKLETTQIVFLQWGMEKQTMVLINRKVWTVSAHYNLDEFQRHYPEWKKPASKSYICHVSLR